MRPALLLAATIVIAMVVPAKQPIKRTQLLQHDLAGMEGTEVVAYLAEIAGDARSGKHYHRGHEAFFILAGSGILEVEGQPPRRLKTGDAAYLAPGQVHNTIADRSGPIKLLVFEIHEKDHWMAVPVQ